MKVTETTIESWRDSSTISQADAPDVICMGGKAHAHSEQRHPERADVYSDRKVILKTTKTMKISQMNQITTIKILVRIIYGISDEKSSSPKFR